MGGARLGGRYLSGLLCAVEAGGCSLLEQPCVVNFYCKELPKAATEGLPSAAISKPQPLHRLVPEPPAETGRESFRQSKAAERGCYQCQSLLSCRCDLGTEVGGLVNVVFSVETTKSFQRDFNTEQRCSGLPLQCHNMRISAFSSMGTRNADLLLGK